MQRRFFSRFLLYIFAASVLVVIDPCILTNYAVFYGNIGEISLR